VLNLNWVYLEDFSEWSFEAMLEALESGIYI